MDARTAGIFLIFASAYAPEHVLAAESFPSKAVRIIVPFPSGGGIDILARAMASQISESIG